MKRHGVKFGYTWGVNKLAVAELTLGFMLMGLRYVMPLNLAMRAGERPRIRNGLFLTGRTVGIHGCGNIGKEVVRLLRRSTARSSPATSRTMPISTSSGT